MQQQQSSFFCMFCNNTLTWKGYYQSEHNPLSNFDYFLMEMKPDLFLFHYVFDNDHKIDWWHFAILCQGFKLLPILNVQDWILFMTRWSTFPCLMSWTTVRIYKYKYISKESLSLWLRLSLFAPFSILWFILLNAERSSFVFPAYKTAFFNVL